VKNDVHASGRKLFVELLGDTDNLATPRPAHRAPAGCARDRGARRRALRLPARLRLDPAPHGGDRPHRHRRAVHRRLQPGARLEPGPTRASGRLSSPRAGTGPAATVASPARPSVGAAPVAARPPAAFRGGGVACGDRRRPYDRVTGTPLRWGGPCGRPPPAAFHGVASRAGTGPAPTVASPAHPSVGGGPCGRPPPAAFHGVASRAGTGAAPTIASPAHPSVGAAPVAARPRPHSTGWRRGRGTGPAPTIVANQTIEGGARVACPAIRRRPIRRRGDRSLSEPWPPVRRARLLAGRPRPRAGTGPAATEAGRLEITADTAASCPAGRDQHHHHRRRAPANTTNVNPITSRALQAQQRRAPAASRTAAPGWPDRLAEVVGGHHPAEVHASASCAARHHVRRLHHPLADPPDGTNTPSTAE
jgi:hypothetical protein